MPVGEVGVEGLRIGWRSVGEGNGVGGSVLAGFQRVRLGFEMERNLVVSIGEEELVGVKVASGKGGDGGLR